MGLFILLGLVVVIGAWVLSTYNRFITLNERVDNGKAQISTQIESRWDAIKSLIDATKEYSAHEMELLSGITEARASLGKDSSVEEIEEDSAKLDGVIGRLIAVSEGYPDLKASEVYQNTMTNISKYEDNVRHSRMIYNDVVTKFNRQTKIFPASIIAGIFGFSPRDYFQSSEEKADMPSW